ncbi:MAG TPA: 1-deoxy-D-xylulose-5-phosphate reductoisomerase [Gammaproteobacteria bacterium]|nr:1-deoxy-D-xylulose-5-phosphate reductoisomerase [Gammaproteobacteria bacterium]
MIGITILGATGSIGVSTLDVISRNRQRYRVVALTANRDAERLFEQCMVFRPDFAVLIDENSAKRFSELVKDSDLKTRLLTGPESLEEVASLDEVDYVMAAIVGAAGLLSVLAAARSGKRILLANKEALVMSGKIFLEEVRKNNAVLLPIDSEHNAIFQCMPANFSDGLEKTGVTKILLTASGGPFRETPIDQLNDVTPEQACAHPNWDMGRKISVDSATMMNKGLEVIEACWLFNTHVDMIQVVLHPQSVIHSMVQYSDGSVLAQLGNPDMRTPIAHSMAWPERMNSGVEPLNILEIARLDFTEPDFKRFPCLRLAYQAMTRGGTAPAILNAANEIAVESFLGDELPFMKIAEVIDDTLNSIESLECDSLETILDADRLAREKARQHILSATH